MQDDSSKRGAPATPSAPGWIPAPGTVIAGRYRLEGLIGRGGMGAVVAAQHIALEDRVAVKLLDPELASDLESIQRFVREAKAAARIKSDHVVRVLDVGSTEQGLHYIVMDRLEGSDLSELAHRGPLSIQLAADCVLQAADALAEAHSAGIVHRDIKPANLWISTSRTGAPHLRVLDFGISKLTPTSHNTGSITDTQSVFGSPTYMSPEQIRSAKHVDARTDVWALGIVLYEILTGALPFFADNVAGVIASISSDVPRPMRELRADVPPEIERVTLACLEKDPGKRATLHDLATALAPFASAAGQASAERIQRVPTPAPMTSLPPPRPSSKSDVELIAMGTTQHAFDTSHSGRRTSSLSLTVAAITMGVGLLAFAVAVGVRTLRGDAVTATASTSAPSAALPALPAPSAEPPVPPTPSSTTPAAADTAALSPPPSAPPPAVKPSARPPAGRDVRRAPSPTAVIPTHPQPPPTAPSAPPTSTMPLSDERK